MTRLSEMKCEVCRVGGPGVTDEEAGEFLKQIPDWQLVERAGVKRLERVFKFKNFVQALAEIAGILIDVCRLYKGQQEYLDVLTTMHEARDM